MAIHAGKLRVISICRLRATLALGSVIAVGAGFVATGAFADNVTNDATVIGNNTIAAGASTTITYQLVANNSPSGDVSGCDADALHSVTVSVAVPAAVTASTGMVVFTACGPNGSKTVTFSSNAAGDYAVTHTVSGGVSGSVFRNNADFTLHVAGAVDTTPPVVTVPSDITKEATSAAGAVATFTSSATDAVDGTDPVTCSPVSGSTFALGTTEVTCTATDNAGNHGSSHFNVTVASDRSEVIGLASVSISATVTAVDGTGGASTGTVASNGTVTLSGAFVDGTVTTPSGEGAVVKQKNGHAASYGTGLVVLSSDDPTFRPCASTFTTSLPKGPYTYDATKGDLTVSGGNQITLAGGQYCFHNVTLSGGSKLIVSNGTTTPVRVSMTGQFNGSGGSLLNMTNDPVKLQISTKYTGNNAVVLSGGSQAFALVFAPNGQVVLSGGSPVMGALLGNTVVMSGNSLVHCVLPVPTDWKAHFA